jgi:hypothetical protein
MYDTEAKLRQNSDGIRGDPILWETDPDNISQVFVLMLSVKPGIISVSKGRLQTVANVTEHVPIPRNPPPPHTMLFETSSLLCGGVKPFEVQRLDLFLFLPASDTLQKQGYYTFEISSI